MKTSQIRVHEPMLAQLA